MKKFYPIISVPTSGSRIALAALLALTIGIAGSASAQPRGGGQGGPGGGRIDRDAFFSKRVIAAIEEKKGKPLTAAQKQKVQAAVKTRSAANKAANDKFAAQITSITGLKGDDLRGLGRGMGRGQGGPGGQGRPGGRI